MNRIQAHLVRRSFEYFRPCGPAMVARVVRGLSDSSPALRSLLPDETGPLHSAWFRTLSQIVERCDEFRKLEKALGTLGHRAARAGASPAHYSIVRRELLAAMRELAGDDWTHDLNASWDLLLEAVTGAMLAGAIGERRAA